MRAVKALSWFRYPRRLLCTTHIPPLPSHPATKPSSLPSSSSSCSSTSSFPPDDVSLSQQQEQGQQHHQEQHQHQQQQEPGYQRLSPPKPSRPPFTHLRLPEDTDRSALFQNVKTVKDVLQILKEKPTLRRGEYVAAFDRINRFASKDRKNVDFLLNPIFLQLLRTLSMIPLSALGVGVVTHGLSAMRIRQQGLEDHIQRRVREVHQDMSPAAVDSYLNWAHDIPTTDKAVFDAVLEQVLRQKENYPPQFIVSILKRLQRLPFELPDRRVIEGLANEFVRHHLRIRTDRDLKYGRMGDFCWIVARLGLFSPEMVQNAHIGEYCIWAKDRMNVIDVMGLLSAFAQTQMTVPEDMLAILLARTRALLPTLAPADVAVILYSLGRGPFAGEPCSPLITEDLVAGLSAIAANGAKTLPDLGKCVYGLAGLPKHPALKSDLYKLAKSVTWCLETHQQFRGVADLMLIIEGFAGLSDVHQCTQEFMYLIFGEFLKMKTKFNTDQATRVIWAFSSLPYCKPHVIASVFRTQFPDNSKFQNSEEYSAFLEALNSLDSFMVVQPPPHNQQPQQEQQPQEPQQQQQA